MTEVVKTIAEAELSDGLLTVVEDFLNKGVFHVFKEHKNVQPNHDGYGIMRYLMHVIHALGYRADQAEEELRKEKAKVKLLEEMIVSANTYRDENEVMVKGEEWEILTQKYGPNRLSYRKGVTSWINVDTPRDMFDNIYKELQ